MDIRKEVGIVVNTTTWVKLGRASRVMESRNAVYAIHVNSDGRVHRSVNCIVVDTLPNVARSLDGMVAGLQEEAIATLARYNAADIAPTCIS